MARITSIYIQMDYSQLKVRKDLDQAYCSKLIHSTEGVRAVFIVMLLCTMDLNSYQRTKRTCIRGMAQGDTLVFTPKI